MRRTVTILAFALAFLLSSAPFECLWAQSSPTSAPATSRAESAVDQAQTSDDEVRSVSAVKLFISGIGLLLIIVGIFGLKALKPLYGLKRSKQSVHVSGVILATVGAFLIVGALTEIFQSKGWIEDDEKKCLQAAEKNDRPVIIDFWANWCQACKELFNDTFQEGSVKERLKTFVRCKINMDLEQNDYLYDKYGFSDLPTVLFIDRRGEVRRDLTLHQFESPKQFHRRLDRLAGDGSDEGSDNPVEGWLGKYGLLLTFLLVYGSGVLVSLTPCVYPLIPVTISVIGARSTDSRLQGFLLSFVYVLGIVITYTSLGLIAASFGLGIGRISQNVWVVGLLAVILGALGLSFMGLFELALPSSVQTWMSKKSGRGYMPAFIMGLLCGFVAAPCVGPVLLAILAIVAKHGSLSFGFWLLLTFAFGMGTLFLILGTFSSLLQKVPKSGPWMEGIKRIFAITFFTIALYYIKGVFPPFSHLFHWLYSISPIG